jgi:TatD DNase family protein
VIDTHAHLDACEAPADALERARAAGVSRVITIGSGIESCRAALEIAAAEESVSAALGIHPHQAGEATDEDLDELRRLLAQPAAVAVGETGLDYYREYAPRGDQERLFRAHADLAAEFGKALVVHSRAADDDTLEILAGVPSRVPIILHCFSSPGMLDAARERGYYVSFAGNVTFPKAVDLRLAATLVLGDRILAETDSPYLAPQPVRGRVNEPANVVHVFATLAEARSEDPAELERRIDENASRVFALP